MITNARTARCAGWFLAFALLAVVLPTPSGFGQFTLPGGDDDAMETGNSLVAMEIQLDGSAIVPGRTAMLGIRYTIKPKWHIYWRNPGESGSTTVVDLTLPEGFTAGPVQWPRPEVFRSAYDTTFGYGKETMLFVPITVPAKIDGETVAIGVRSEWLVCKEICLFGEKTASIEVPVAGAGEKITFQRDARTSDFARYQAQLPRPIAALPGASAGVFRTDDGPVLRIEGPTRPGAKISFLPDDTPGVRCQGSIPMVATISDGRFQLEIPLEVEPDDAIGKPLRAAGIVVFGTRRSDPAYSVVIPIASNAPTGANSEVGRPKSSP